MSRSNYVDRGSYRCLSLGPERWQRAISGSLVDVVSGEVPEHKTEVRLFWSGDHLHVRVEVEDDFIESPFERRGDPVYLADAVEVFLDPSGLGRIYFEIDLSPNNVVFDALVVNRQRTADAVRDISTLDGWDCEGLVTRTDRTNTGWRAEFEIPLSALAPPVLPSQADRGAEKVAWRFNVYRVSLSQAGATEFQALYPTGRIDFHRPMSFGELVFVD